MTANGDWLRELNRVLSGGGSGEPQGMTSDDYERMLEISMDSEARVLEFHLALGRLVQASADVEQHTLSLLAYLTHPEDYERARRRIERNMISKVREQLRAALPQAWPETPAVIDAYVTPFRLRNLLSHNVVHPFVVEDGVLREGVHLGVAPLDVGLANGARSILRALSLVLTQAISLAASAQQEGQRLDALPAGTLTLRCVSAREQLIGFDDAMWDVVAQVLGEADYAAAARSAARLRAQTADDDASDRE